MSNVADDISHSYQDGFNDGVRSVFSKTGFFLVKDEKVYAVDMPYEFKYQKSVDMMTGKVHYPTNRMRLRGMTDEELAKKMSGLESFALTCGGGWPPEKWLDWLREEGE